MLEIVCTKLLRSVADLGERLSIVGGCLGAFLVLGLPRVLVAASALSIRCDTGICVSSSSSLFPLLFDDILSSCAKSSNKFLKLVVRLGTFDALR